MYWGEGMLKRGRYKGKQYCRDEHAWAELRGREAHDCRVGGQNDRQCSWLKVTLASVLTQCAGKTGLTVQSA